MRFLILGPLEAYDGDRKVPLGGTKQRALLAMLLLHSNEVVSSDRLIDALWTGAAFQDAAKALTVAVSRLRKALEPERGPGEAGRLLVTRPPGYELRLDVEQLDLHRFERLVADSRRADPHTAARLLRDALALWRGAPLADLAYESFAQAEIARLEESRLEALEHRIDADLALGQSDGLVGELEGLTAEHPHRERLRAQLMLALYRSGRQAEALESYQRTRAALVEELGIEPGRRLRELHQAILRQDPGLDLARPERESSGGVFVGRERELGRLVAGVDEAFAGHGRLFLLEGEAGIGKSRLAEELTAYARTRGGRVLIGRCWEAGGAPAYWPWTQLLRAYVRETDVAALGEQLGAGAPELVQIVPELGQRFPELTSSAPQEPDGARVRLFDATAEFLRVAGEQQPLVLVLDDLHAADPPSLLLVRFLARELGSIRILLLGAYRQVDPLPGEPLTAMIAEVGREPVSRRVTLRGLSESEVAEYLRRTGSEFASPQLVSRLYGQTEGNPLFVGEMVRLLSVEGDTSGALDEKRLEIPQSVRQVIARRVSHLSQESGRLLLLASVLGREFSFEVLSRVWDVPDETLVEVVDEAIHARVVSDVPGAPGRLRFEHVLIRDTLYDGLTSARRLQLHGLIVGALEELDAERPGVYTGDLAHHSIAAADYDKAQRYAREAASRALELFAYEEAARLFRLALQAVEQPPVDQAMRFELLVAAGDALNKAGITADAKEAFLTACDLARTGRMPEGFARAALGYGGSTAWQRAAGDELLVPLLEEALIALGTDESLLKARLLARLAGALRDEPSLEPRSSLAREAVEIARRLGDKDTLAYTLSSLFAATWGPEIRELSPIADELGRLAEETGSIDAVLDALTWRSIVAWHTLADADAASTDDAYDALAGQTGEAAPQWQGAMQNALWALFRGEFARAEKLEQDALRTGQARSSDADCSYRFAMFIMRRAQGRLAEIEDLIRDAVARYPGYRSFACFIPVIHCALGRDKEAREAFEVLAREKFAPLPRDCEWLFCLSLLAEVAARLHDRDRAIQLYRLLEPYARVNAMAAGEVALGPVARYLGILATETARWMEAARHFEDALAMNAKMGARPWLAHTMDDYGHMLLARDRPGDRERARELLAEAVSIYRELGMDSWAARIQPGLRPPSDL
jgi:DNA-binding SARP family transcriptional activator